MTNRNYTLIIIVLWIAASLLNACGINQNPKHIIPSFDSTIKPSKISIQNLVEDYESYQGKYIETTGEFFQGFEEFAIYARKPFFGERKGFWLETDMNLPYDSLFFEKINGSKVTIKGIVDTTSKGHLGMYIGTIRRIYSWEQR